VTNGRATVFVTNVARDHDYTSLARYGAMRPVTSGNYPVFKTARLTEEIIRELAQSTPDDYLAFSGSGFVAGLCLTIWLIFHKECHTLLYDRKEGAYVHRLIKRSDLVIQIEKTRDEIEAEV
jgi:hypothetical protein